MKILLGSKAQAINKILWINLLYKLYQTVYFLQRKCHFSDKINETCEYVKYIFFSFLNVSQQSKKAVSKICKLQGTFNYSSRQKQGTKQAINKMSIFDMNCAIVQSRGRNVRIWKPSFVTLNLKRKTQRNCFNLKDEKENLEMAGIKKR